MENQTRSFVITGNNPVTGLEVNFTSTKMQVGETKTIQATISPENADNQNLIFTSNNEEVATVDEQGVITAIANGTAVITVASDENAEISQTIEVTVQELVESEEYVINNDTNIINYISENTTAQSFLSSISVGADEYQLLNTNGESLQDDSLVGTGTILKIGETEYTLIVTGDTNGDGQITITDVSQVKLHFIGLELLSGIQLQAGDTNHDGEITITDVSQIKLHFIGLELIQNERPSNNEEEQLEED